MLLDDICADYGILVLSYEAGGELLRSLHLDDAASRTAGLACYMKDRPVIFFDQSLPPLERIFVVAHEVGHIMLGHVSFRQAQLKQTPPGTAEQEANSFAVHLIAQELVQRYQKVYANRERTESEQ